MGRETRRFGTVFAVDLLILYTIYIVQRIPSHTHTPRQADELIVLCSTPLTHLKPK